jgi:hypothetical protein
MEHFFKDQLDLTTVFESKNYSEEWLAGIYSHLSAENADVASKGWTPFNFISDDMLYVDRQNQDNESDNKPYSTYKTGMYDEKDPKWGHASWTSCYEAIRDASTFIHNIDINKEMTPEEIKDYKAQARFLRAYYYWLLLRKYGPVPLLPDEGIDITQDYADLSLPRNTYEECVDLITSELALAAIDLPLKRDNRNIARPTRGSALAARAKVYLFSASPLFNGNADEWAFQLTNFDGKRLISATPNNEKWAKAAAAAKEVMDLGVYSLHVAPYRSTTQGNRKATVVPPYHPKYSNSNFPDGWADIDPFESYREVFNGEIVASDNPELIFTRGLNQSGNEAVADMVMHQMPTSTGSSWGMLHGLTLKMFDAYYMNDGSEFPKDHRPTGVTSSATQYPHLGRNVSLQNANREPRFYASVAYNGSVWECESYQGGSNDPSKINLACFYYRDDQNGKSSSTGTDRYIATGIGIKKYYHPRDAPDGTTEAHGVIRPKVEPAIRYAEVLLIYAEALNELEKGYTIPSYDGQRSVTVSRDVNEMSRAMSLIRIRAGLPDFDDAVYASGTEFRKALKHERQIELMGENHRYFDLRRWKDAAVEETMPIEGFNMDMVTAQRDLFHTPVVISYLPTVFVNKMYLWPISHTELKRNKNLIQNPGWTYYE